MKLKELAEIISFRRKDVAFVVGDVVIYGVGVPFVWTEGSKQTWTNGCVIRCKQINPALLCCHLNWLHEQRRHPFEESYDRFRLVPVNDLRELEVSFPSQEELDKAASILSLIEQLERKRDEQAKLIKELKDSLIHRLFVEGKPISKGADE